MLNYKNALWFHAGRARTPGQPNHTDLISLLFITGSLGVCLAQQLRAASAAAARQTIPAAGASRGSISLVKNQAFPPFLFLRDVRRHPGLVYIPSLQDLSRLRWKNFWEFSAVFTPKDSRELAGAPGAKTPVTTNRRNVGILLLEFGSFRQSWMHGPGA